MLSNKKNESKRLPTAKKAISRTPKRKMDMVDDEKHIDTHISIKKQLIEKVEEIEDEDFDLKKEAEYTIRTLGKRHRLLATAVRMDRTQRGKVDFEDSETAHPLLDDVLLRQQDPVIIYETDLEPLNKKLTDFLNVDHTLADPLIPTFDDIRTMLKEIREGGECSIYQEVVPKEGTEAFDDYIIKILGHVKERIRGKRYKKMISDIDEQIKAGLKRKGEVYEQQDHPEEFATGAEPSTSGTSMADKLKQLKEEGAIVREEEPSGEDVDDLDNQSDVNSESSYMSGRKHQKLGNYSSMSTIADEVPVQTPTTNVAAQIDCILLDDSEEEEVEEEEMEVESDSSSIVIEGEYNGEGKEEEGDDDDDLAEVFAVNDEKEQEKEKEEKQSELNGVKEKSGMDQQEGQEKEAEEIVDKLGADNDDIQGIGVGENEVMPEFEDENSILVGESAISPPPIDVDPTPTSAESVEKEGSTNAQEEDDDDDVICID